MIASARAKLDDVQALADTRRMMGQRYNLVPVFERLLSNEVRFVIPARTVRDNDDVRESLRERKWKVARVDDSVYEARLQLTPPPQRDCVSLCAVVIGVTAAVVSVLSASCWLMLSLAHPL